MANKKISELTGLTTPASGDFFPCTDISDTTTSGSASGTTKKVTLSNLMAQAPVQSVAGKLGVVSLANADVSGSASSVSLATDKNALQALINLRATQVSLATDKASLTGLINARATGAQGTLADSATQPGDNISTLTNDSGFITSAGSPVQSVASKTGAVALVNADVSGSASSVSLATDKASLTGLINLRALTSSLGTASTKDVGTSANNVVQLDGSSKLPAVDGSNLTGISSASSAVDGTAVTSTGETGATKFLREDGDGTCSFQNVVVGDAQLRGTDNPHIGAFPNQSLKVIDNPSQSVVVVADSDGNLDFVVKTDASRAYLSTPSSRLELTTGVSVVEDSSEPDIEITTSTGTYSLITGDSDALGVNGLPIRQGFNSPDIGANQAPLLISGGTIS